MSRTIKLLALSAGTIATLSIASCFSDPAPVYYQSPEVHNVTIVEKPSPSRPKPTTPTPAPPESFRAVY